MTRSAPTARELRTIYRMAPIPEEGGYFALGPRTTGLSCITALLTDEPAGFSALHVLTVDEGWPHTPATQRSPLVQALASSHTSASGFAGFEQVPVAMSHVPAR